VHLVLNAHKYIHTLVCFFDFYRYYYPFSFIISLSALKRVANKATGLNPAHPAGSTLPYPRVKQELNDIEDSRPLSISLPLPLPSSTDNQLVHDDSDERTAQYIRFIYYQLLSSLCSALYVIYFLVMNIFF
jgi:hypothetical protein